ncbi:MAG: lysophospholipid acyltransferase family protein [Jatrophihabitantaceae bacterium]
MTTGRFWRGVNHAIISVMHFALLLTARRRYRNLELIPRTGGAVVASNHLSLLDAFVLPHAVRSAGRNPLGMGKIELFRIPVLGAWFTKIGHVSVDRAAPSPSAALAPAADALRSGKVLCMYPEGTINTTPERGLLDGRTGVVRLAMAAGVPIVPIGQWGPQHALSARGRLAMLRTPRLFGWLRAGRLPRRPVCKLLVGQPISPAELAAAAGPASGEPDYRAATDYLMTRLGALVAEVSGLPAAATLGAGTPAVVHRRS